MDTPRLQPAVAAALSVFAACHATNTAPPSARNDGACGKSVRRAELAPGKIVAPAELSADRYGSGPDALRNRYFELLQDDTLPEPVKLYAQALRSVFEGRLSEARHGFMRAADDPANPFQGEAIAIVAALLENAGAYAELADWVRSRNDRSRRALAELARLPRETVEFVQPAVAREMRCARHGVPMIVGAGNGKRHEFIVDTGAALTTLATSTAAAFGVKLVGRSFPIGTATQHRLKARFGLLRELRFGEVVLRNHPVFVVDDEQLTLHGPGGIRIAVDAVIGWNALRKVRLELDFVRRTYSAIRSVAGDADRPRRNLFWLGYPLVEVTAVNGQRLLFGLDSGSGGSSITGNLLRKLPAARVRRERQTLGGHGGIQEVETEIVAELSLVVDRHRFDLKDVRREEYDDALFVQIDGVLGADLLRGGSLVLDFPNGALGVR